VSVNADTAPGIPDLTGTEAARTAAVLRRVLWRLVPFLFLCYVVAAVDRVYIGFAKLHMLADLGFGEAVYGLGAGLFFLGYVLFDLPSNLVLHRVGARVWIARILITRGLVAALMPWVDTPAHFYLLRFVLGVMEAGLFPGILYLLSQWVPLGRRAGALSVFMTANAVAGVAGGPVAGLVMQGLNGVAGWAGWQWLFMAGALPSVLMGLMAAWRLDDRPAQCRWLDAADRVRLQQALAADPPPLRGASGLRGVLAHPAVWRLAAVYFGFILGFYGLSFWLPQLLRGAGVQDVMRLGALSAVPYGVAAAVMVVVSRSSDRRDERRWHTALTGLAGALGLGLMALAQISHADIPWMLAAASVAAAGCLSALPLFWTLPGRVLQGREAAAGLALVNGVGNLAGFVSPFLVGLLQAHTGQVSAGLWCLALGQALGSALAWRAAAKTRP